MSRRASDPKTWEDASSTKSQVASFARSELDVRDLEGLLIAYVTCTTSLCLGRSRLHTLDVHEYSQSGAWKLQRVWFEPISRHIYNLLDLVMAFVKCAIASLGLLQPAGGRSGDCCIFRQELHHQGKSVHHYQGNGNMTIQRVIHRFDFKLEVCNYWRQCR